MENIIILNETPEDYRETENLVRECFWNVYKPGCSEHYVLHVLRGNADFVKDLDFVMKLEGKVIGQIVFVKNRVGDVPVLTMGPICIDSKYRGKGLGRKLLEFGLDKAKEQGYTAVLIEGDYNFYSKSGFDYASKFGLKYEGLPEGADSSFFLCKELKLGSIKPGTYAPHPAYLVDDKDVDEFDKNFPKKTKLKLPTQIF
ncbi:MAG: N-acetyltransferase [Coriobacteriales bacterium]|nr:N-acetyltransferase [Coriobacteriales bacterium]